MGPFSAKEAVFKSLGARSKDVEAAMKEIELCSDFEFFVSLSSYASLFANVQPMQLHGEAIKRATDSGIADASVLLTVDRT